MFDVKTKGACQMCVSKFHYAASLCCILAIAAGAANAGETQLSGFGSFIVGLSNNDEHGLYEDYATESLDFKPNSLAAIQAFNQINDKASVTVQVVARGLDGWDADIAWAYVRYQPRTDLAWKLGRMSSPFYLYSDSKNIGFSYPWISPPYSVYNLPFNSMDGADIIYSRPLGAADLQVQAYVASSNDIPKDGTYKDMEIEIRNGFGVNAEITWQAWKFRYGYNAADIYVDFSDAPLGQALLVISNGIRAEGYAAVADNYLMQDDYLDFQSAATHYDNGRYFAIAEISLLSSHDSAPLQKSLGRYLTGGIRQNEWSYLLTYMDVNNTKPNLSKDLPQSSLWYGAAKAVENAIFTDAEAWIAGFRWDFTDNFAFKGDVTNFKDRKHHKEFHNGDQDFVLIRLGVQTVF